MKLVALLAWYDEPADMLYESVASLEPHIDYMIAVDGSYPYYPGGQPSSPPEQQEAIKTALEEHRIGWEIVTPGRLWCDEAAKRSFMFKCGAARTTINDWYLIWDADFFLTRGMGIHERLASAPGNVATVDLRSSPASREPAVLAHRLLFRAHPALRCGTRHNIYLIDTDDGPVYVWGHSDMLPALDMTTNLGIWHDPGRRSDTKMVSRETWQREQAKRERQKCA